MPLGSKRSALMYGYQPQPRPIRPPSDVSSRAESLRTIGPSASMVTPTPARGRHDPLSLIKKLELVVKNNDIQWGKWLLLDMMIVEKLECP